MLYINYISIKLEKIILDPKSDAVISSSDISLLSHLSMITNTQRDQLTTAPTLRKPNCFNRDYLKGYTQINIM